MVGSELGHYRILSALGKGGTGEVYLDRDTNRDFDAAVKILPERLPSDPEHLARFRRGPKAAASPPSVPSYRYGSCVGGTR